MKKKPQHTSLAQQNGFGPAFVLSLLQPVKGTTKLFTFQIRE
jgi:hypothetical protein